MPAIKIDLPKLFSFSAYLPIRITDINYGGHVGNDSFLSIIHEARVRFLQSRGYSEMDLEGVGLIMRNVAIEFKQEFFYGDTLKVSVAAADFSKLGFYIFYKIEKEKKGIAVLAAVAKTWMICYDYTRKKMAPLPESVRNKLSEV